MKRGNKILASEMFVTLVMEVIFTPFESKLKIMLAKALYVSTQSNGEAHLPVTCITYMCCTLQNAKIKTNIFDFNFKQNLKDI